MFHLKKKKKGYAVTFEVIMSLWMMSIIISCTGYLLSLFDASRYMSTILTSTIISIAEYGGTNTNAYIANDVSENIIQNSQDQLDKLSPIITANISGSPDKISKQNQNVYCTLNWTYNNDNRFNIGTIIFPSKTKTITISMNGIMHYGKLL
jgi:hypothetical protein